MKTPTISSLTLLASALGLCAQTLSNYQATVAGQNPNYYFTFDGGSLSSSSKGTNANVITLSSSPSPFKFGYDIFVNPSNMVYFSANNDTLVDMGLASDGLISTGGNGVASTNSTASGSVALLFRSLSPGLLTAQKYIFSAGFTASNHNMLALNFENTNAANGDPMSLKLRFGDNQETILQASNVVPDTWYYFAFTYTESTNGAFLDETGTNLVTVKGKWYLGVPGGTLSSGLTTNAIDAVAGENTSLYLGIRDGASGDFFNPGSGAVDEFATWRRRLSDAEITNQFTKLPQPLPPGASYEQVVNSQVPKYYFKLNNSLTESVGGTLALSTNGAGGAFTNDFLGNLDWAYSFSQTNDALYITNDLINGGGSGPNDLATGVGTISFQFRMLSDTNPTGQRFIFSAPGSEATGAEDNQLALFIENSTTPTNPSSLKLRVGNTTKGSFGSSTPANNVPVAYPEELVSNAWYYFAMTYDESRTSSTDPEVRVYFGRAGGTLTNQIFNPANNAVVGDNGWLVLGNKREIESIVDNAFQNPGEGVIDEFAIWHRELSPADIQAQFAAMVAPTEPPTLNIARSAAGVVLSWTTQGTAGFQLESTTSLSSPSWTTAGTPTVVVDMNYVTNGLSGSASYYRLKK